FRTAIPVRRKMPSVKPIDDQESKAPEHGYRKAPGALPPARRPHLEHEYEYEYDSRSTQDELWDYLNAQRGGRARSARARRVGAPAATGRGRRSRRRIAARGSASSRS